MVKKATQSAQGAKAAADIPTETAVRPGPTERLFAQRGLTPTSLRLPAETLEDLRVAAFNERCSRSEIVRRAVAAYLKK